ncbi:MAG: AbiV family abortive infection protein [Chitinophagales bacterium]|nr:AbiV family abortive infection protein [Chitinophagales bacterium]
MSNKEKYIQFNAFRRLCIKNAEDNLKGARELAGKNLNHLSFHLCILTLEEIGKIFMAWMKLNQVENWDRETMNVALDDHIKKLFFAIWGPSIGKDVITKDQWSENQFMARNLHELRLLFLYGSLEDQVPSSQKVSDELLNRILSFTQSRFDLAAIEGEVNEDDADIIDPLREWFQNYMQIESKSNYIVSATTQAKLIELGDIRAWMQWLKDEHEKETATLNELSEKEINKPIPENFEKFEEKWEINFTLITPSHSIRKKEINAFNKYPRPFSFAASKDKHTLKVKVILPSVVTVHILWHQSWYISKTIAAALSIATRGIFYWHVPIDTDVFYDSIIDLESKQRLRLSVPEQLKANWQSRGMVLQEQEMHLAGIVHDYFLHVHLKADQQEVEEYMTALSMLCRTDIHLRLDFDAFRIFFNTFRQLLLKHEKIANKEQVFEVGYAQIQGMIKGRTEYDRVIKLALDVETKTVLHHSITMTEVLAIKIYCDIYILTVAVRTVQNNPEIRLVGSMEDVPPSENSTE